MQTLKVIDALRGRKEYDLVGLVCNGNIDTLEGQILVHRPRYAVVLDERKAAELASRIKGRSSTVIEGGEEAALRLCRSPLASLAVVATVGFSGLLPTIESIRSGKDVALANKETLVTAGSLVMKEAIRYDVELLPIDSEHSAIWQALEPAVHLGGERHSMIYHFARGGVENPIEKIILTASGGPFRGMKRGDLDGVSVESALKHPTWKMGGRITIDSATLMNKGFELIEAMRLFQIGADQVEVVVHPQSIMHSGVRLIDGNEIMVQSLPNMEMPIQYAITWPQRLPSHLPRLDLASKGQLSFQSPDIDTFDCLKLAIEAARRDGTAPAVLNGADEKAVELFLSHRIGYLDIGRMVRSALEEHRYVSKPTIEQIREADAWAREHVTRIYAEGLPGGRAARRVRA